MNARERFAALGVAFALLVALDVVIVRVNVFGLLLPNSKPMDLLGGLDWQMVDVLRALRERPPGPPPVVILGNSQMDAATKPLRRLERSLTEHGARAGTRVVSLCVFATGPSDAEVLTRELGGLHPGLVLVGLTPPDLGMPLERARRTHVARLLDVGFGDGLLPPADTEARLDRWVRTVWHLYRYRTLFLPLLVPPPGRRVPIPEDDGSVETRAEILERFYGPEEARALLALRARFEQSREFSDFVTYVELLRGPDYLPGLRDRWRALTTEPLQLEALRRSVAHVEAVGGRTVWVLLPENPIFEHDPEVGALLAGRSNDVVAVLRSEAERLAVPLLDLRRTVGPSDFLDLNHLDFGMLQPLLATRLAEQHLL